MDRVTKRLSLRGQMTVSYLLVTAAAVLLAELIILVVVFPQALAAADRAAQVHNTATGFVKAAVVRLAARGELPTSVDDLYLAADPGVKAGPDTLGRRQVLAVDVEADGRIIPIRPLTGAARPASEPVAFVLLLNPDGSVRASSYPGRYPAGTRGIDLPASATSGLRGGQEGSIQTPAGEALWASMPIIRSSVVVDGEGLARGAKELAAGDGATPLPDAEPAEAAPASPKEPLDHPKGLAALRKGEVIGSVYVQVPAGAARPSLLGAIGPVMRQAGPALRTGLGLLLITVPVGVVFGLLATRRLTRRIRRLAVTTAKVADGNLSLRVPVDGADEVSQLEVAFNSMAARLGDGMAVERQLAGANARLAERARIARELHDAISQSLFSLGMTAGGLRRALPAGSPLADQVAAMESTVTRMSQEMRVLLLELRPAALEEAGLVPALEELCRAYESRLGVTVNADLGPVILPAPVEHAVLRLAQEALANAVRHGDPTEVEVRLAVRDGWALVAVSDDGCGFDPAAADRWGMGLTSMRERVEELGGRFELISSPGPGTTVRALLPVVLLGPGDPAAALPGEQGRGRPWPA